MFQGKSGTFEPADEKFLWRWASAGTLPVISIGDRSYYCLFFRDIFPIGWNIANGACDTRNELLDPLEALERELGEELVVVNPRKRVRYVLEPEEYQALDRAEFATFRRLWQRQFPKLDLVNYKSEGLALHWEHGPDHVTVKSDYDTRLLTNCYVNINALDFGIELDRIARIKVPEDVVLCDGEATPNRVLNRPVGLFDVQQLQKKLSEGAEDFTPEKFFHCGKAFDGKKFETVLRGPVAKDVDSWRSRSEIRAFKEALKKDTLKLCPVTRSIVRRHIAASVPAGPPDTPQITSPVRRSIKPNGPYDVFISFGEPDRKHAAKVARFLKEDLDCRVFFAPEVMPSYVGCFGDAIDSALLCSTSLVVVATALRSLVAGWVRYEVRAFHDLYGIENPESITPFISGFSPVEMPMPLRLYQAVEWGGAKTFSAALQHLRAHIARASDL